MRTLPEQIADLRAEVRRLENAGDVDGAAQLRRAVSAKLRDHGQGVARLCSAWLDAVARGTRAEERAALAVYSAALEEHLALLRSGK